MTDDDRRDRAEMLEGIGRTDDPGHLAQRLAERLAVAMAEAGPGHDIPPQALRIGGRILADLIVVDEPTAVDYDAAAFEASCRAKLAANAAAMYHADAAVADLASRLWAAAESAVADLAAELWAAASAEVAARNPSPEPCPFDDGPRIDFDALPPLSAMPRNRCAMPPDRDSPPDGKKTDPR